ncbi:MAG TPA: nucleoside recognition domain-containing protein [Marinagarivorans sp.]|nr:nucleoside recognition domain-containing protein [Cellvibrionaceae bacterium]HMY40068.1 nucleoside recognition domain-containing protein [Marinagarivorans sp.]HNG58683.1 nucleoside recognition domain-containing protein [Cellvibrionaceae bacterium]
MLNHIWAGLILLALASAALQALTGADAQVLARMTQALIDCGKLGFELAIGLTGMLCLWLGLLAIAEAAGLVALLSKGLRPLFVHLFPQVPKDHPAMGSMSLNIAANMLGLDNAATPLGLRAMAQLQTLNPHPEQATSAQTLFLIINTASVTLLPVSVLTYRAQLGAAQPADVFLPLLLTSLSATLIGVIVAGFCLRLNLRHPVVLAYGAGLFALIATVTLSLNGASSEYMQQVSQYFSQGLLLITVAGFLLAGVVKKVPVYEVFINGAKEGFSTAVTLIPYLVAMFLAISLLRASGSLDMALHGVKTCVNFFGFDARWVDALPTMILKSLSGSGARASMLDVMRVQGADSFAGRLVSIIQGSSETTFYVLTVYFGSVGIRRCGIALGCALVADVAAAVLGVIYCYGFFG